MGIFIDQRFALAIARLLIGNSQQEWVKRQVIFFNDIEAGRIVSILSDTNEFDHISNEPDFSPSYSVSLSLESQF